MTDSALLIALLASMLSGFFAASNLALKWFNRGKLAELLDARGQLHRLDVLSDRLVSLQLMTATLRTALNLFVLLAVLYYVEVRFVGRWPIGLIYLVAFLVAGTFVSILAVAVPTSWARYRSEAILVRSLPFLLAVQRVLLPLLRLLHLADPMVRRISGAETDEPTPANEALTDQVMSVVEEHVEEGHVDALQKQMIEAVFEFRSVTAGQIMTPRTDMVGVEISSDLAQVRQAILDNGFSRYPVYRESLDDIVGLLYVKDLVRFLGFDAQPLDLAAILRDALIVPESKPVQELLAEFKARKVHLAIVLDEYGGTAGLVSIEDVLEELVGEIQDEYESAQDQPRISRLDARSAEVDARVRVDELNDAMTLELPESEDYDTVGGLVFSTLGHIPIAGETVDIPGADVRLVVLQAERTKINRLRVESLSAAGRPAQAVASSRQAK
ncbi:MAG: HlyC/CorC family transporter [Phycisphaeraceae bacterium]|nr:HlyC/CorC family transporter [Phycisphaeraceae bacterium]